MDASPAPVDLITYQRAQARIQGSLGTAGSDIFPSVIRLIASGRIDPLKMITARYPLAQAADAIAAGASEGSNFDEHRCGYAFLVIRPASF